MILSVKLGSTQIKGKIEYFELFIDAAEVVRVRTQNTAKQFDKFILDKIAAVLPIHFYSWDRLDWQLMDHTETRVEQPQQEQTKPPMKRRRAA